jgi:hypothetical protein
VAIILQNIVERGFSGTVFAVFYANPDEAAGLRNDPNGEGYPCTVNLRPTLHVQKLAIGNYHWDSNACCKYVRSYWAINNCITLHVRVMRDDSARARTEKCRER